MKKEHRMAYKLDQRLPLESQAETSWSMMLWEESPTILYKSVTHLKMGQFKGLNCQKKKKSYFIQDIKSLNNTMNHFPTPLV